MKKKEEGSGFGVQGVGFRVLCAGFRGRARMEMWGSGFGVQGLVLRVEGCCLDGNRHIWGEGFGVEGSGGLPGWESPRSRAAPP